MKKIFILALIAMASVHCNAANDNTTSKTDTLVVSITPRLNCNKCIEKIRSQIRFVKGTKKVDGSVKDQTMTIVYDAKKATKADYEAAYKKIGYQIQEKKSN